MNSPIENHGSTAGPWFQTIHSGISSATIPGQARNATSARRNIGLVSRPEVGRDFADALELGFVRLVARRLRQRRAVPLLHRGQGAKLRGISLSRHVDRRVVGLDAECDRRVEGIRSAEARACEERATEAVQSIGPEFLEPCEIAL